MIRVIKNLVSIVGICFSAVFILVSLVAGISQKNIPAMIVGFLVASIFLGLSLLLIRKGAKEKLNIKKNNKIKLDKKRQQEYKLSLQSGTLQRIKLLNATLCINANHISGLPFAEDSSMYLYLCDDKVIFERNEFVYNLYISKIKDIIIKTDLEIQKTYISSIGGAIAGGYVFGPLGAIICGRVKEKKNKIINKYLIFTYEKEDTVDFISFDVTNISKAQEFVTFFSNNNNIENKKEIYL
ncbi:hypothetical protein [Clostridium butyricum]|uniref:hypothetical protein n=1 Tax=Clostridium butyricum TaxID=1492 RepID=UPI000405C7E9|nr:hypothetical protein [Clostridium butyricum]